MGFNRVLADIKAKLSAIEGIKTCKLGLEANLAPADYPIIRICPKSFKNDNSITKTCNLYIYFGLPLVEGVVSLEDILGQMVDLEEEVIKATESGDDYKSIYRTTLVSDNSVEHYQLFVVVLDISYER